MKMSDEQISSKEKKFTCLTCGYKTQWKGDLTVHQKAKHQLVKFHCKICNYKTGYQKHLNQHMKSAHDEKKYILCNICESKFTEKYSLSVHTLTVHNGIKY